MKVEDIEAIVLPILQNRELFPVELKISKDNVIELFVDGLQGVNISTCIEISREIEACLDREVEDFELTVSSAGIGYPFKVEGQFRKNLNKTVEVKTTSGAKLTGILKVFDQQNVVIEFEEKQLVEGSKKKQPVVVEKAISRGEIREIKDVINF